MDKISKDGIYDMTIEDYHSDCCEGPSVSASSLKQILDCPAKYWATSYLNPDRIEVETSSALNYGKIAHALMLEGKEPEDEYHMLPKGFNPRNSVLNKSKDEMTAAKINLAAAEKAGKIIVKGGEIDFEEIRGMQQAMKDHPYAWAYFEGGEPEKSLIWKCPLTGVWLKTRPDYLPGIGRVIPDYKTAASAHPNDFQRDIAKFKYHQQAALVCDGIQAVTDKPFERFAFVAQEKKAPFVIQSFDLAKVALDTGRLMNMQALLLFKRCWENEYWPGYDWRDPEHAIELDLPKWTCIQFEDAVENGEYDEATERLFNV